MEVVKFVFDNWFSILTFSIIKPHFGILFLFYSPLIVN